MRTILLDVVTWDLVLGADGNIAVADAPYALAQDAASAIRLFQGECWYNTTIGIPYFELILGKFPPLQLMIEQFQAAALRVPGVVEAVCYITDIADRRVRGQVQVADAEGVLSVADF